MTPTSSDRHYEEIIARFMRDFEWADDKSHVVEFYCRDYPPYSGEFRSHLAAHNRLNAAAPEPVAVSPRLTPGEMIGDFRVVRYLTHGGMGEIYEAEQVCLNKRRVVLKLIRQGKVAPDTRARFLREQKALAGLHQTNIVPVFAAGERDDVQYFAMQYIDGATLGHVVQLLRTQQRRNDGISQTPNLAKLVASVVEPPHSVAHPNSPTVANSTAPSEASDDVLGPPVLTDEYCRSVAATLADVADALNSAHRMNVLHRDVKPSNLMAERSGKCWVIDFGLAGLIGESAVTPEAGGASDDLALTATGAVMGTYAYMAPEQFDGLPEPRSDVWSMGVTLYELLTLRRPFDGRKRDSTGVAVSNATPTREEYHRQVREDEPVWPCRIAEHVPTDLDAICRKAMQKGVNDRYRTAAELATDLRHWLRSEPTIAKPPWPLRRIAMWAKRQPGWAAMVAVACLSLFSLTGMLYLAEHLHTLAAVATAQREMERAAVAEQEANQRQRQLDMLAFQREQLSPHTAGWRDRLWSLGSKLAGSGKEPELRDRMAALLSGLDAKHVSEFQEGSATFLAFDSTGRRVLIGGYKATDSDARNEPTRVRSLATGEIRRSTQDGVGPVGWRGEMPVQLVPPTKARLSFLLWNVDLNDPVEEFALPDGQEAGLAERIEGMSIAGVVLSADAKHVAAITRGPDGRRYILVWRSGERMPSNRIPIQAPMEEGVPEALALSSDGCLLALGTHEGRVVFWSLNIGPADLGTFELGRSPITALSFGQHRLLPDPTRRQPNTATGWLLAVGDSGGTVAAWDVERRERTMLVHGSHHEVFALAFSSDGLSLFSSGRAEVRCTEVLTRRELLYMPLTRQWLNYRNWIPAIALTPNGNQMALGSIPRFGVPGGVDLLDLEPGRGIQALRGLTGQVSRVCITPDGKRAAGLTQDWQVGVWDVSRGELLMRVHAPVSLYADHNDIRLTDDGRFLVIAGGKETQHWEVPATRHSSPRKIDSWVLHPAYVNRLAITADGKVLLCRNETVSGKDYPLPRVNRANDPRCVRIYELQLVGSVREIAQHDDHKWHVHNILAVPNGSCFIADGINTKEMSSRSIIAYSGQRKEVLWRIKIAESDAEGWSKIDSTGTVLSYCFGKLNIARQRLLPHHDEPDTAVNATELPALRKEIVYMPSTDDPPRLRLAVPGAIAPFLTISPIEKVQILDWQFTADGHFFIWGLEDGTVLVADMQRVRDLLNSVGMGWEKPR